MYIVRSRLGKKGQQMGLQSMWARTNTKEIKKLELFSSFLFYK